VIQQYLTKQAIIRGLEWTILLTVIAMVIGVLLGLVLAVMRMSPAPVISGAAWAFIWFFRGTPVFVQILAWYAIGSLIGQRFDVNLPFTSITLFQANSNQLITPLTAAVLALSLNEGAYMAEIARAGLLSVDAGQTEAAESLGMGRLLTLRKIVLPQAMRVIIPPTGNETISMLKTTSLVSAISFPELTFQVTQIQAATYIVMPLFVLASIWYLIITSIMSIGQYYLERHYARGSSRELPPTPVQRFRRIWIRWATTFHAGDQRAMMGSAGGAR
jgi:polar amino acid transport system permease protein